jgi:hypothetical protein
MFWDLDSGKNLRKEKVKKNVFEDVLVDFFQNQSAILTPGFGFDNLKWVSTDPS